MSLPTSLGFSSSNLASVFQNSYQNALLGKNSLGTSGSLASSALLGQQVPGSNPLSPLQGQTAVMGLGAFVADIQSRDAQRKAGLIPSSSSSAAASSGASAGGLDSSSLATMLNSVLSSFGGSTLPSSSSSASKSKMINTAGDLSGLTSLNGLQGNTNFSNASFDTTGRSQGTQSTAQLMGQLQEMFTLLTQVMGMMSGQGTSTTSGLPQGQQQLNNIPQKSLATNNAASALTGSSLAPVGGTSGLSSLTGANALSSPTLFSQQINMNVIDSAINQALGGISSTLPMVGM
jgi:hypothetical protein